MSSVSRPGSECLPTCHLVLDGYELISQAGLPDTFTAIDDDPVWPEQEYGND